MSAMVNSSKAFEDKILDEISQLHRNPNSILEAVLPKKNTRDHRWGSWFPKYWKKIFLTSCMFAVLLDPLFLYVPIINQELQCLRLDNNLKIAALVLRSLTDFAYLMDIIFQVLRYQNVASFISELFNENQSFISEFLLDSSRPKGTKTIWWSLILIDILAVLPIPQIAILIFFSTVGGSRSLNTSMLIMNFFVLLQYVPRVIRIYESCQELRKNPTGERTAMWVKGVLNFFMYILASHVLGAIWYFFAVQRMTICWGSACQNVDGCVISNYSCDDRHDLQDTAFLSDSCPLNPVNTTLFDFGIFLSVLQSGLPWSTNYQEKLSNCFWWGLRNLSSLGSNLQPSINTWENLFASFISVIGLLLFIYLIGNIQTYMQLETARVEEYRHKMRITQKMEKKSQQLDWWLSVSGISKRTMKDVKPWIMVKVRKELEENGDIDIDNVLSILPAQLRSDIKSRSPMNILKKVPKLNNMDEEVLTAIYRCFKPMSFSAATYIIREKDRLGMILLIKDGVVKIESGTGEASASLDTGDFYGEQLLDWVNFMGFPMVLPFSTSSVQATNDVEVLVLMAQDLFGVVTQFREKFSEREFPVPKDAFFLAGLDKLPLLTSALRIDG